MVARRPPGVFLASPPVVVYSTQWVSSKQSVTVACVGSAAGVSEVIAGIECDWPFGDDAVQLISGQPLDEDGQCASRWRAGRAAAIR